MKVKGYYQKWLDYVPQNEKEAKLVRDAAMKMRRDAEIRQFLRAVLHGDTK